MRKLLIASIAVVLSGSIAFGASQKSHVKPKPPAPKPIVVKIGEDEVAFPGAQPQTMMGRIMVPVRGIFEKIGAYVEYNPATHVITSHYQNESIEITMGNKIANVNGAEIVMEVPATIINGNALVPLRFLAESMGAKVDFDAATNTVTITPSESSFGGGEKGGSGTIPPLFVR